MTTRCALAAVSPETAQSDNDKIASAARQEGPPSKRSRRLTWDKRRTEELFRRYREDGDEEAREELIVMYMNLVSYLASKFRNRGEPLDDLVQVGAIGLIKAVSRFDPSRELQFTTYATPTIVGEIKRHFRDKGWMIKVPRTMQELSHQVNRAVDELTAIHQKSPTIPEIALFLGIGTEQVLAVMESSNAYSPGPLDTAGSDDEDFSLLDVMGDHDPRMSAVTDNVTLAWALKHIEPQAQKVIYLRFFTDATQSDIAKQLGVSQMQVSRTLRKALATLRSNIVGLPSEAR